jgi:membrane-associated phospholipid phosphatase
VTWIYFFRLKQPAITNKILLSIIISCVLAYIFYLFFQNSVERPQARADSLFNNIYLWINQNVPPYNAFPSLHVAISLICGKAYFTVKSRYKYTITVWVGLIILSTVLTKQHYFMDIVGGVFLAIFSYNLSKRLLNYGRN